jgi:hypothetical protein
LTPIRCAAVKKKDEACKTEKAALSRVSLRRAWLNPRNQGLSLMAVLDQLCGSGLRQSV